MWGPLGFHLGRMHEIVAPEPPFAVAADIPEAPPVPPLAPWDFPLSPLPNVEMEPMSPGLPSMEILPPPVIPVIDLSSALTPTPMNASPPVPIYHPLASPAKEDPFEEASTVASRAPEVAGSSRRRPIEILSRHPRIIRTPHILHGRGACGRSHSGSRH